MPKQGKFKSEKLKNMSKNDLVQLAFLLGSEWGKRYERLYMQAGLDNAMGDIDTDTIATAARGGMSIGNKDRQLIYKAIAFQNAKTEIVNELENHNTIGRQKLLDLLEKLTLVKT